MHNDFSAGTFSTIFVFLSPTEDFSAEHTPVITVKAGEHIVSYCIIVSVNLY